MVNNDIFVGSGTSLTFIPEVDFYIEPSATIVAADTTVTLHSNMTHFRLVANMYVGSILEHWGASGTTYSNETTTFTFNTDTKANYVGQYFSFSTLQSNAGTEDDWVVWFDTTGSATIPAGASTLVSGGATAIEVDISNAGLVIAEEYAATTLTAINTTGSINTVVTRSGTSITSTNDYGGPTTDAITSTATTISHVISLSGATNTSSAFISTHRITLNDTSMITFHPAIPSTTGTYFILKGYGSPCPAPKTSSIARLLSDEWLGIVDSATFPNIEIDMKQHNLFIGGSRNLTFQYKGLETASGGSFEVAANHGAWLYYTLGKCTGASSASIAATNSGVSNSFTASTSNGIFIDNAAHLETGPIFYRAVGTDLVPPLMPTDVAGSMDTITNPATNSHLITYDFEEASGHELPSFALERTYSKLSSATDTYLTETGAASETENFVTVARGNRVNSLTITGSEQDPIKMNLDLNTRAVHALGQTEAYEARNGVETETSFFNYNSNDSFLEPFFFHEGTIKMFGQNFLKITQFTLTINNNIADKRYIGISSREVKDGIPAQRTYELTFTAHVTDDMLFEEFRNLTETSGSLIELIFTKANNEKITIKLDDYFITSNNWNIPDDKGPIDVEATIQARTLNTCEVISHWILQG
jgi:hypothetical protein